MNWFSGFLSDERGAASVEYILILSGMVGVVAAGALYFGNQITAAMTARGDAMAACGTTPGAC